MLKKDPSLWKFDQVNLEEVSERLGWLDSISFTQQSLEELCAFANEVRQKFSQVVLLGMGGSSLAPEVFMKIFGNKEGYPSLLIVDTTNPEIISKYLEKIDVSKTVFVVSSKSGGTIETLSLYKFFFSEVEKISPTPGKHFIAITDPGSKLENIAKEKQFLKTFFAPSDVGGRYSVFTVFGMVPAALIGAPLEKMLNSACNMQASCTDTSSSISPVSLGISLGTLALQGKNKLTFVLPENLVSFGDWVEQLVAESTGKLEKGVLPVIGEPLTSDYSNDRVFICLTTGNIPQIPSGHPVFHIPIEDTTDIGGEFLRWQVATAVCGSILEINPFDQPDVELAKIKARELMQQNKETSSEAPKIINDSFELYATNISEENNVDGFLNSLFSSIRPGDYFNVMAYLPYDEEITHVLQKIRCYVQDKNNIATTVGFGPRFLHSTGQLHKGDNNSGVFLQITHTTDKKIGVPGENYDFNTLIEAQAAGDYQALKEKKRRVLRYHINGDLLVGLKNLFFTIENDV
ncbi:hypothetical protein [Candidatus Uabimicrobium sp. HlEnr_7]|uniref:hypothetical protein n=1 Tax=Candidatus Uabimicrobium helgolandensis TaxID=3095367 RepID=UPI003558DF26